MESNMCRDCLLAFYTESESTINRFNVLFSKMGLDANGSKTQAATVSESCNRSLIEMYAQ